MGTSALREENHKLNENKRVTERSLNGMSISNQRWYLLVTGNVASVTAPNSRRSSRTSDFLSNTAATVSAIRYSSRTGFCSNNRPCESTKRPAVKRLWRKTLGCYTSTGEKEELCAVAVSSRQWMVPVVELISVVVSGYDVQQQDVFCLRVQTGYAELHLWEHLSVNCKFTLFIPKSQSHWKLNLEIHIEYNFKLIIL